MPETEALTPIAVTNANELDADALAEPRKYTRYGEQHRWAKLTDDKVCEIRGLYEAGGASYTALGKQFGVDYTTIRAIVTRKTWRHVI